jgi:hypothetical protein
MITTRLKSAILVAVCAVAYGAPAYAQNCQHVAGRVVETVISPFASPADPFGRIVSRNEGTINGVGTAIITSIVPGPGGPPAWNATTRHVLVESAQDQLVATGAAQVRPIPGNTTDGADTVTLTVNGAESLGRYAGATGTITYEGTGFNFYGPFPFPDPAAGSAYFVFHYEGTVCLAGK